MSTSNLYCGIDISADTFDICMQMPGGEYAWHQLPNDTSGFRQLLKLCAGNYHFVMETTGIFHLPLCFFLQEHQCHYSVVNALQVKRYIQMNGERNKTDKKDAFHICMYGIERQPEQYQMPDQQYFECRCVNQAIETVTAEITAFTNKLYALKKLKGDSTAVRKTYALFIKTLKAELKKLKAELHQKMMRWQPELVKRVRSVKGIGDRATATLIVATQGFKHTHSYRQLISYAGLSPREYRSGKSIKGRVHISKTGGKHLRHVLYMCALNAKATNPACKALYDRLVEKGKNKKLALIAVCNKLLKQVFAIVTSGVLYSDNYYKKTA